MDRERLLKQAKILRQKRQSRDVNKNPQVQRGVVKLEQPLPMTQHPKQTAQPALSSTEIRRKRALRILEQRNEILAQKRQMQIQQTPPASPPIPTQQKTGCGHCKRK